MIGFCSCVLRKLGGGGGGEVSCKKGEVLQNLGCCPVKKTFRF